MSQGFGQIAVFLIDQGERLVRLVDARFHLDRFCNLQRAVKQFQGFFELLLLQVKFAEIDQAGALRLAVSDLHPDLTGFFKIAARLLEVAQALEDQPQVIEGACFPDAVVDRTENIQALKMIQPGQLRISQALVNGSDTTQRPGLSNLLIELFKDLQAAQLVIDRFLIIAHLMIAGADAVEAPAHPALIAHLLQNFQGLKCVGESLLKVAQALLHAGQTGEHPGQPLCFPEFLHDLFGLKEQRAGLFVIGKHVMGKTADPQGITPPPLVAEGLGKLQCFRRVVQRLARIVHCEALPGGVEQVHPFAVAGRVLRQGV